MALRALTMACCCTSAAVAALTVTPEHFGAVGDGTHDDTKPVRAALAACSAPSAAPCQVLFAKHYATGPLHINNSSTELHITGTLAMLPRDAYLKITADQPPYISNAPGVEQLRIHGGGLITGIGRQWWPCKYTGCWRPHLIALEGVVGVDIGPLRMSECDYPCDNPPSIVDARSPI